MTMALSTTQAASIYVGDSRGNLGTVDVTTGAVSLIGNMGVQMTDIAVDSSGNLFGISFSRTYRINKTTAAPTLLGSHSISFGNALTFGPDGTLYGAGNRTTRLFSIDTATGAGTSLGNTGFFSAGDLAFNGGDLFLASTSSQLVNIDLDNIAGGTAAVGFFGVLNMFGLATGSDGQLYGTAGTNVYSIDTATGAATFSASYGGQGLGAAFGAGNPTLVVPVPAAAWMGLSLLGGLSFLRKIRRNRLAA